MFAIQSSLSENVFIIKEKITFYTRIMLSKKSGVCILPVLCRGEKFRRKEIEINRFGILSE